MQASSSSYLLDVMSLRQSKTPRIRRLTSGEMSTDHKQTIMPHVVLPRFLTVGEIAEILRCKRRTIYDMVEQRRIPYRKAGGRLLFDLDEIIAWTRGENTGVA